MSIRSAVVALVLTIAGFAFAPLASAAEPQVDATLVAVNVENAPEWAVDTLIDLGYHGDPADGQEALYVPAQVDVEDAPEQLVEALLELGYQGDPADGHERLYAPGQI